MSMRRSGGRGRANGRKVLAELLLMAILPVVAVVVMSRLTGGFATFAMLAIIVLAGVWTMGAVDKYLDGR